MKKFLFLIFSFLFLATATLSFTAMQKDFENPHALISFDDFKESIVERIDLTINTLNTLEQEVSQNPNIPDSSKNNTLEVTNMIEKTLLTYQNDLDKTTSAGDLLSLNQEILDYLRNNQELLRDNLRQITLDLAIQTEQKANDSITELEQILHLAKKICPEQRQTIFGLEAQAQELKTEVEIINQAIENEDTITCRQKVYAIYGLSLEIYETLQLLEVSCMQ